MNFSSAVFFVANIHLLTRRSCSGLIFWRLIDLNKVCSCNVGLPNDCRSLIIAHSFSRNSEYGFSLMSNVALTLPATCFSTCSSARMTQVCSAY